MRLWKYEAPKEQEKPDEAMYHELLSYISKTFEFTDTKQFRITYQDEDDEMMTIASLDDFQDAFLSAKLENKKSLKLHIVNAVESAPKTGNAPNTQDMDMDIDDEEKKEDDSAEPAKKKDADNDNDGGGDNGTDSEQIPSAEEIDAFFSDDFVMDLLSDLFVSVFEALQESQFEISFIECIQGIILSDDGKYDKVTANPVWPYFMEVLLPMHAPKMEQFVVPMLKMNAGGMDANMIKQWIPTILGMMKMHIANQRQHGGRGRGRCRGRGRGWRGRGRGGWWNRHAFNQPFDAYGNHHGFGDGLPRFNPFMSEVPGSHVPPPPPHHHVSAEPPHPPHAHHPHMHHHGPPHHHHRGHHHHHRGRHHRGWRGRRGGWRGGHRGGYNAWSPANQYAQHQDEGAEEEVNRNNNNVFNDQAEHEEEMQDEQEFEYTEELVAIMNMGFGEMAKVKRLLIEHHGNKENVVQELVLTKN